LKSYAEDYFDVNIVFFFSAASRFIAADWLGAILPSNWRLLRHRY